MELESLPAQDITANRCRKFRHYLEQYEERWRRIQQAMTFEVPVDCVNMSLNTRRFQLSHEADQPKHIFMSCSSEMEVIFSPTKVLYIQLQI